MAVLRVIPAGDLALKNGSPYFISGPAYIRQKLSIRFRFFLGEWFLNQLEGVPYYRDIFVHDPNIDVITSVFKRVILSCPGVLALKTHKVTIDRATRRLRFEFSALVTDGEVIVRPEDGDFVIDLPVAA